MFRKRLYQLFFALALLSVDARAQPPIRYLQSMGIPEGLASNTVFDLCIDKRGFLWIATENGLDRYDGTEFTHFVAGEGIHAPSSNLILQLLPLSDSTMALAAGNGLNIFNHHTGVFRKFYFNAGKDSALYNQRLNIIFHLAKDASGNLWAGTDLALIKLDSQFRISRMYPAHYAPKDLNKKRLNYVRKIFPLHDGTVLTFLENELFIYHPSLGSTDALIPAANDPTHRFDFLKNSVSEYVFQAGDYLIYLKNGRDSLYLWDSRTGRQASCYFPDFDLQHIQWQHHFSQLYDGWVALNFQLNGFALCKISDTPSGLTIRYFPQHYLTNNSFNFLMADQEKNIWTASWTEGLGQIKFQDQMFTDFSVQSNPRTRARYEINAFLKRDHYLLAGSYGDGFYETNLLNGVSTCRTIPADGTYDKQVYNTIWNFRQGDGDTIWIGTQGGLFWHHWRRKTFGRIPAPHSPLLDSVPITTQFTDSRGTVWMGLGIGNGLCTYEPVSHRWTIVPNDSGHFPYRYPIAVAEDSSGDIWFLSDNSCNLVRWRRQSNQYEIIDLHIPLKGRKVWVGLFIDDQDQIWFGIESVGLLRYQIGSGRLDYVSRDAGFQVDAIQSIRGDRDGRLWLASAAGILCFDPQTEQFIRYRGKENFTSEIYEDRASCNMFAAAFRRVVSFMPEKLKRPVPAMPVLLTALTVNDQPVPLPADRIIRLSAKEKDILISFTGIDLANGNHNRYAYQLSGGSWVDIGSQRQVRFASLAPGEYDVVVKAKRLGADFSAATDHLHIIISPPFTSTVWFYLLCFLIATFLAYIWYHYRLRQILKIEKMRERISRDLHDELGSQLTNISYLSLIGQRHTSSDAGLQELLLRINEKSMRSSASLREIIYGVKPESDTIGQWMPRLIQYAAETLEMKDILVHSALPASVSAIKLNLDERRDFEMIFKEAVNNIVKHSRATEAWLELRLQQRILTLAIDDNGSGSSTKPSVSGNGLANMHARAEKHGWILTFPSKESRGFCVCLSIKITRKWYKKAW